MIPNGRPRGPRPSRPGSGTAALLVLALLSVARAASGQSPPQAPSEAKPSTTSTKPIELSILSAPPGAYVSLSGESDVAGQAPLDLPTLWTGRYSVEMDGAGLSRTQAVLYIPPRGGLAYSISEPPGASIGLLVRSVNFPGLPAITSRHAPRGALLAAAGLGSLGGAIRAHALYRNALKDDDLDAADRAGDFRRSRDMWTGYLGAVWGLSAIDYWIRSRMSVLESTPSRVTLTAPTVTRTGVVWRSLLVPGAGQEFANRRARGAFWLGTVIGAGAGFVLADGLHQTDVTQLVQAERELALADSADMPQRLKEVERRSDDVQTSEDIKDGFVVAAIALYAANVFDSLVLPISRGAAAETRPKVSAVTRLHPRNAEVALSLRF